MSDDNKLTQEQAEYIAKSIDESYENPVKVEYPEEPPKDKKKVVNTVIDPDTGEAHIESEIPEEELTETFEEKVSNTINTIDIDASMNKAVTTEEFTETLIKDDSMLKELTNGMELSQEDIKGILVVTNKVIKKEKVNVYKELPESIQKMIDNYITAEFKVIPHNTRSLIRRSVATTIINRFISDIQQQRAKYDFANELANIYKEGTKDIEDTALSAHNERNKIYREVAEEIEDPDKKKRMLEILDQIDEAKNLTKLKEFAKICKIKSIEIEKPKKVYTDFLNKYRNSSNNIYDINIAVKSMLRNINKDGSKYTDDMVYAFYVAFCKQVMKYKESDPLEHAYMYYVLYYSVMTDAEDSKEFINNVKEVIDNLVERNPRIKK